MTGNEQGKVQGSSEPAAEAERNRDWFDFRTASKVSVESRTAFPHYAKVEMGGEPQPPPSLQLAPSN